MPFMNHVLTRAPAQFASQLVSRLASQLGRCPRCIRSCLAVAVTMWIVWLVASITVSRRNSLRYRDPCVRTHRIVDGPSAGLRFQDSPHSNGRSAASRCGMSGYVAAARIRCIPGQIDGPRRRDDGAACALLGPAALRKVRALFRQTTHGLLRLRVLQMPGGLQRS